MTTKTPEALAVLDTMARGCALWADFCVGPRKAEWMAELAKYDKARAAFAAEHEALKIAVLQNSHDMLMTGEELRICEAALAAVEVLPK